MHNPLMHNPNLIFEGRMTRTLFALLFTLPLAALSLGCPAASDAVSTPPPQGTWELVWSDEFDGAAGTPPDSETWENDIGTGKDGWGNLELQSYTEGTRNVVHDGQGHLVITARKEPVGASAYSSARIHTQGKREFQYGRFEARIRLPRAGGSGQPSG